MAYASAAAFARRKQRSEAGEARTAQLSGCDALRSVTHARSRFFRLPLAGLPSAPQARSPVTSKSHGAREVS